MKHVFKVLPFVAVALLADLVMPGRGVVSAEPVRLPKQFYERNFAGAPGGVQGDEIRRRPQAGGRPRSQAVGQSGSASQAGVQTQVQSEQQSNPARGFVQKTPREKRGPLTISLIVNSLNAEHFQRVINEALRLHDARIAVILSIDHIGDYRAVTPDIEAQLHQRGIPIRQIYEVPERYGVSQSPLWIVQDPKGLHLAAGGIAIDSLIDEFGEYDPKRAGGAGQKMDQF